MTRGKYGAKAANRRAATDNEVIADMRAELAAAHTENTRLATELADARRALDTEVATRAATLTEERVTAVQAEATEYVRAMRQENRRIAEELNTILQDSTATPAEQQQQLLARVIAPLTGVTKVRFNSTRNRADRRAGAQKSLRELRRRNPLLQALDPAEADPATEIRIPRGWEPFTHG